MSSTTCGPNANPVWQRPLTDRFGTMLSSDRFGFLLIEGKGNPVLQQNKQRSSCSVREDGATTIIHICFQLKPVPWSLVQELWDMHCTVTQDESKNEVYWLCINIWQNTRVNMRYSEWGIWTGLRYSGGKTGYLRYDDAKSWSCADGPSSHRWEPVSLSFHKSQNSLLG